MKTEFLYIKGHLTREKIYAKIDNEYKPFSKLKQNMNFVLVMFGLLTASPKESVIIKKMINNGITDRGEIVEQFVKCNLAAINSIDDIDENGNINSEYVECGFKGANKKCPFSKEGDPKPYCIKKLKCQA